MPPQPHSIFLDWEFWSAVAAVTALALSQLPPVYLWFRPRQRVEVEVQSRVQITHKLGNPNLWMYVSIRNTGSGEVEVRSIQVSITRDTLDLGVFPATTYFEEPSSKLSVLFVPFVLKAGDVWAHGTSFLNLFDRTTEKWYRQADSALREDILKKRGALPPSEEKKFVEAEPNLVVPFTRFFEKTFVWNPGEYVIGLKVTTKDKAVAFMKRYRFTLFESDEADLRSYANDYKIGGGIYWTPDRHTGVWVPITPQDED
jgi:hypothetical protein